MIVEPLNDAQVSVQDHRPSRRDGLQPRCTGDRRPVRDNRQELAEWISLPQRNDEGDPDDGPRVPCDVSQRLRLPAEDPNCVERSALYMAAAEIIDPGPLRRLATIDTPIGRHTFPVENDVPVRLDPRVPRNALDARGVWRIVDPTIHAVSLRGTFSSGSYRWPRNRRAIVEEGDAAAAQRGAGSPRCWAGGPQREPPTWTSPTSWGSPERRRRRSVTRGWRLCAWGRSRSSTRSPSAAQSSQARDRTGPGTAGQEEGSTIGRIGLQTGAPRAELLKAKLGILGFAPEIVLAVEQILGRGQDARSARQNRRRPRERWPL